MSDASSSHQPRFIPIGSAYPKYPYKRGMKVYQVVHPLPCAKCKKTMQVKDILTLHYPNLHTRRPGQPRGGLQPYCITCYPVSLNR